MLPPPSNMAREDRDPRLMIKSTIKGAKLHSSGDLNLMLRYNATQMFIQSFNNIIEASAKDYSISSELLWKAMQYNNTTAFKYMYFNTTCMILDSPPEDFPLSSALCKHGNIDIFKWYIATTMRQELPKDLIHIFMLMDTGNEQFVRLVLEHAESFRTSNDKEHSKYNMFKFRSRGISVGILRMMHEYGQCLYRYRYIWHRALLHSVKCNMMDSVQYIIDNVHDIEMNIFSPEYDVIYKCLMRCAKAGNISMFNLLINTQIGGECLSYTDVNELVKVACDHSQMDFLQHLVDNHNGNGSPGKMPVSILACIRSDDLEGMESLIQRGDVNVNVFELDAKLCHRMSASMAVLITSPRITRLKLGIESLVNMVEVVSKGKHASNITVDVVCNFILNCDFDLNHDETTYMINSAMVTAAGFSVQVLEHIHTRFDQAYGSDMLGNAIRMQCRETILLLLNHLYENTNIDLVVHTSGVFRLGTLDLMNEHIEVLEYVISHTPLEAIKNKDELIGDIIQSALRNDRPQAIQWLENKFGYDAIAKAMRAPNLSALNTWIHLGNAPHTLEHLFSSTPFTNLPRIDRLRALYTILNQFTCNTHVIRLCSDQIKAITSQVSLESDNSIQPNVENTPTHVASTRLQTVLHSVFNDHKLGMLIMSHVGHVHRSLGIPFDKVIKGSKLLDNHSLSDYLRYGATEWFLQSYSNSIFMSKTHHRPRTNSSLLELAFLKCDSRAIDALLNNPCMTLRPKENGGHLGFLYIVSTCKHPDWERIFDQYLTINDRKTVLESIGNRYEYIQHPSFIRKLVKYGCLINIPSFNIRESTEWLTKPYAMEMLETLFYQAVLGTDYQQHLILEAIKHNIITVVEYYIDNRPLLLSGNHEMKRQAIHDLLVEYCCRYGRVECLAAILPIIPGQSFQKSENDNKPKVNLHNGFMVAAGKGHVEIAEVIHSLILSNGLYDIVVIYSSLTEAFKNGHLDMINYLFKLISSSSFADQVDSDRLPFIHDIHANIMSVEFVERLMTVTPTFFVKNNYMLLEIAIEVGNREVIDIMDKHNIDMDEVLCIRIVQLAMDIIKRDDIESLDFVVELAISVSGIMHIHKLKDIIDLNECNTPSTLAHIMDKGFLIVDDNDLQSHCQQLELLLSRACINNNIDLMQVVHQRCTTPTQLQRHLPSLDSLIEASKKNNHQMLSYLFEGDDSPFNRANPPINMASLINTIRHHSIDNGHLNIINMCDRLLN
ncbi:hypothetical protein SAMD00019534_023430 [Acytostelium subglobosum LB1]|uniref:hypothetical protein n=1 Tax=Acytostelium subglobosum LB1 TaxID=1410327 RepID=UPI00064492AE|nr:hypothetical protein SAMD00019534_023430 [Acytostelium subglobosum LB1]GAM19168.1 hypothetical protein SAMD00019534_023430 [Acytostelium subglobosum LB1]|eukprot:XP_012757095.1 hypothetical protein SAMD00019534_023430 [Acytostelium subglobosum LB1]